MIIMMRAILLPCSHCSQTANQRPNQHWRRREHLHRRPRVQSIMDSWRRSSAALLPLASHPVIECLPFRTTTFELMIMQVSTLKVSTNKRRASNQTAATFPPSARQHNHLPLNVSSPICASSHAFSVIASTFSSFSSSSPSWLSLQLSPTGCLSPTLFLSQFQSAQVSLLFSNL